MAQPSPLLAQLKDIHLPEPIGWWPMAWGWWVLMMLMGCSLGYAAWKLWQKWQAARAKKEALALLALYEQRLEHEKNSAVICANISALLRRVALAYFPRKKVASLQGPAWIHFLNSQAKDINFIAVQTLLLDSAYQKTANENIKPLINRARRWIQQRSMP